MTRAEKPSAHRRPGGATARSVAAATLVRVWKESAFAAAALDAELAKAVQLDSRDAALATELVLGSLRVLPWIERRVGAHAKRGIAKLDLLARAHLVLATYQLFFLERVPSFAAVSEAVAAVRSARGPQLASFVNAVLRRLSEEASKDRTASAEAYRESVAPWLREALARALGGTTEADAFLASPAPPPTALRVERAEDRDAWLARLTAAAPDAHIELGKVSPFALLLRGAGRVTELPGYAGGAWTIQEEGSQLVALALGAAPGERVLDACAGRGNKTGLLARAVLPEGAVDAADLHPQKLERLRHELGRLGLAPRRTFAVDWSRGAGEADVGYDAVLVDAPCSGTGTVRRRPDLLLRRTPESIAELGALELAIVRRAAALVRPGGRLVYAVCSVLREEGEAVVDALLAADSGLRAAPFASAPLRAIAGESATLRLLPHVHGTDGYFLASFARERSGPT